MKFDFLSESDQAYFIHKASTLVEALPFIRQHSGDIIVIKYGGHAMGNPKLSKSFAKDIGLMKEVGIFPVVVHGGGPQIEEKLKSKDISSRFVEGLRVTDNETIKVVEDVLTNEINTEIVKAISESGGKAVGLAGNQNNLLSATKLKLEIKKSVSNIEKIVDIGFVGQPTNVNTDLIKNHIMKGEIPSYCSP
jgi:Acetylglutamate kinase